jgi:choline monooxygenase
VVTRDLSGTLHVLSNVCRHKAAVVAKGTGCAKMLQCRYHAWRYDLDGTLRSAPGVGGIEDFDRSTLSLPRWQVATMGPFVWGCLDPDAPPLTHPEVHGALEASDWQSLTWVAQRRYMIRCNWKVFIDNYLDGGYHIPHMHPTLDAQLDMENYRTDTFARSSIQQSPSAPTQSSELDYEVAKRQGDGAFYAWVYPNFALNRYGPILDTNLVLPMGHDRIEVVFDFWYARPDERDFVRTSVAQTDQTQREDIEISEFVQRGLESATYDTGRYAPRFEIGEHHFHRLLHSDLLKGL